MHTALWCLTGVSILGAIVSYARPKHVAERAGPLDELRAHARARTRQPPSLTRVGLSRTSVGELRPAADHAGSAAPPPRARSMRIGEVAELTGTTPRTIRYYEEIGLLGAAVDRAEGKHRCYTEADVERIREIVRLRDLLGLSLDQLSQLVEAETARAGNPPRVPRDR